MKVRCEQKLPSRAAGEQVGKPQNMGKMVPAAEDREPAGTARVHC